MREARLDASAPGRHSPRSTLAGMKRVPRGFDGVQLIYDLAIIGGGVNGCGIARDAAGRGLSVFLCEQGDLAGATSSASTKLIHGGLRYLEHYDFRLVREALAEREVLLALRAAHHPPAALRPAAPRGPAAVADHPPRAVRLRPSRRPHDRCPATRSLDLATRRGRRAAEAGLSPRLRIFRLLGRRRAAGRAQRARRRRARRRHPDAHALPRRPPRRRLLAADAARRRATGALRDRHGPRAGQRRRPVGRATSSPASPARTRRPRCGWSRAATSSSTALFDHDRAYIFQNADGRVCFAIPYERDFTLIGTTDEDFTGDPATAAIDDGEIDYLLARGRANISQTAGRPAT